MYADYEFYKTEFCGASIPSNSVFIVYEAKARRKVDYYIGKPVSETTTQIKNAVCSVAEILYEHDTKGNIQSESNDGVSVTYRKDKSLDERVSSAVREALNGTGLLGGWI